MTQEKESTSVASFHMGCWSPEYDETFTLQFLKDTEDCGILRKKDDCITYKPWHNIWQNMTENERRAKGIYVICYGHGTFSVFKEGIDVELTRIRPPLPTEPMVVQV